MVNCHAINMMQKTIQILLGPAANATDEPYSVVDLEFMKRIYLHNVWGLLFKKIEKSKSSTVF